MKKTIYKVILVIMLIFTFILAPSCKSPARLNRKAQAEMQKRQNKAIDEEVEKYDKKYKEHIDRQTKKHKKRVKKSRKKPKNMRKHKRTFFLWRWLGI